MADVKGPMKGERMFDYTSASAYLTGLKEENAALRAENEALTRLACGEKPKFFANTEAKALTAGFGELVDGCYEYPLPQEVIIHHWNHHE